MSKVVIITGASKGIGAELAVQCADKNYSVLLAARSEKQLKSIKDQCDKIYEQNGTTDVCRALTFVVDVTKRAEVDAMVTYCVKSFGRVDVLVNNAGVGIHKSTSQLTDDEFDYMMAVNCKSAMYGMQAVLVEFKAVDIPHGQVINVSSMLGRCPSAAFRSAYCAAKHALNSLTATMRMEMADGGYDNILICGFHPGVVGTDFGLNAVHSANDNRDLPDVQPVTEVATVILEQINKGQAMIDHNVDVLVKRGLHGDDSLGGIGVVNGTGIFDVYSRPAYQQKIVDYYSAGDMREHERATRATYVDMVREKMAKKMIQMAEQQ